MARRGPLLTAKRARELFSYDRETGIVRWRITINRKKPAGSRAGTRCKGVRGKSAAAKKCKRWVRQIQFDGRFYLEHRLIWLMETGDWPAEQIDHRNLRSDDNRWANLRAASDAQNKHNTGAHADNTAGLKWVMASPNGRFQACVYHSFGSYRSAEAALAAAQRFAKRLQRQHDPLLTFTARSVARQRRGDHLAAIHFRFCQPSDAPKRLHEKARRLSRVLHRDYHNAGAARPANQGAVQ